MNFCYKVEYSRYWQAVDTISDFWLEWKCEMHLRRKGTTEYISVDRARARLTYVSDEAAGLLLLEELADARPGFTLQVIEVRRRALIHIMHVPLLQLRSFLIHPGNGATPRNAGQGTHQT